MTVAFTLLVAAAVMSACTHCGVSAQALPPPLPAVALPVRVPNTPPTGAQFSSLWGTTRWGEQFKATRLIDYSYAGYMAGEAQPPNLVPTHLVTAYGAKGDGVTDDTGAFMATLAAIPGGVGVVGIPAGRYILTKPLTITSRISFKGAGSNNSVLVIPLSLEQALNIASGTDPGADSETGTSSPFSYRGGFIQYEPRPTFTSDRYLTDITALAKKGTNNILVANATNIKVGEWIVLTQGSPVDNNWGPINQGLSGGCNDTVFCSSPVAFSHPTWVARVVNATAIVIERPLPWELFATFKPQQVFRWQPRISNVGVEGIGFIFKSPQYRGTAVPFDRHFSETGYNAIEFKYMANSWIRDVQWMNADMGINILRSHFISVMAVRGLAAPGRADTATNTTGHHGIVFDWCVDCLLTYFDFATMFHHDIQVNKFATGVVVSYGRGDNLNMDHHRAQNYASLWTQINMGTGARAFASGGSSNRGTYSGPFSTFWNLYTSNGAGLRRLFNDFGPYVSFAGIMPGSTFPAQSQWTTTWLVEAIPPQLLYPANLHSVMWQRRMGNPTMVSIALGGKGTGVRKLDVY